MRTAAWLWTALATVMASHGAWASPPAASKPGGPLRAADKAGPVPGANVRAPDDVPLVVPLPDGVLVTLAPGSTGRWLEPTRLPSEISTWTRGYHLVLTQGEVEVEMPPCRKGTHAFLVSTRAGTVTEWRGRAHLSVHEDSAAAAIYEGAMVVGSNGMGFPVYEGAAVLMRARVDPQRMRSLPAPPAWAEGSGSNALVATQAGSAATLGVAWTPVVGAKSYRIEVASDASMTQVALRATTEDAHYELPAPASTGSQWWARVRSVDGAGIVGDWSAPTPLRLVRFALPPGASVASDGAIVLPDDAEGTGGVSILDGEGLEVAYEGIHDAGAPRGTAPVSLYWTRLSSPVRIWGDTAGIVAHLRDPATGHEGRLVLVRRQLRAKVDLTPRQVTPGQPLDAQVTVYDPTGRIDVTRENISLETTLGLVPMRVFWERTGGTWSARIPPRWSTAPSVIRVAVKDARGAEIGRGFLEVGGD